MEHQYNKNLLQEDLDSSQLSPQNYTNLPESFTPEDVNLIMQVRDHPCIYCTKKSKKSKVNVENEVKLAWEEIGKNLLMNVDYCQHRWIILRQRFSKERMKSYSEDSSEHALAIERYSFYDYMKWLDPYVPRRQKRSAKSLQNNINTFKKLCVDKPNDHISDNLVLPSTSIKETLPRTPLSPPKVTTTQLKSPQLSPPEVNIIAPEEPPNFLDNIGNEEEISTEVIRKTIMPSLIPKACPISSSEQIGYSPQENEGSFSFFEDDDFTCSNDSFSSFNSSTTSSSNSKKEPNDIIKTSSKCNSYDLQREALSNLTNKANAILNCKAVNVKKNANNEKYKILGKLVESHLQGVNDESYKIEIKANMTRILYGKKTT